MQNMPEMKELSGEMKTETTFAHLPDSNDYIQKLENRLTKVKGHNKELTSKDMLLILQKARDDSMLHLIGGSSNSFSSLSDCDVNKEVTVSYVERKLFPEKNGVTYEELQNLLECDVLAKTVSETNGDALCESNVDR
ncbi:uncharacterized protein LOC129228053 [Uloborus diversus]|uniref:uncharacterized protein LOC129228053 n=1 Tax=Uloborus diversus TaxID=327109 RepID=UPI0024098A76|nr:uncharacterized protein LOC129228053 [Uloborus diversus]